MPHLLLVHQPVCIHDPHAIWLHPVCRMTEIQNIPVFISGNGNKLQCHEISFLHNFSAKFHRPVHIGLFKYNPYSVNERILLITDMADVTCPVIHHGNKFRLVFVHLSNGCLHGFHIRIYGTIIIIRSALIQKTYLHKIRFGINQPLQYEFNGSVAEIPVIDKAAVP